MNHSSPVQKMSTKKDYSKTGSVNKHAKKRMISAKRESVAFEDDDR